MPRCDSFNAQRNVHPTDVEYFLIAHAASEIARLDLKLMLNSQNNLTNN